MERRLFLLIALSLLVPLGRPAPVVAQQPDLRQVTTHPDIDLSPRLSPDGKFLAYVSRQTYNFDIWIKSTTSTRSRQVTFNKADDFYPVWYPDSRSLVFVSQKEDAAGDIWRIRFREVKGDLIPRGEPEKISHYQGFDSYPTVSPDGKKIAWVSDASGRDEIWFHNDNTGKTSQLTFLGGTHPAWSSRQDLIAFTSFRAGPACGGDIWLMNLHGPRPQEEADSSWWDPRENPVYRLTRSGAADGFPTWSPDASRIIFLRFSQDTNGDSLLTPADRGALWSMAPAPAPEQPTLSSSPLAGLLLPSFNPALVRRAMPLTSDSDTIMQPWCGGDSRVYFSSDRGGNLDIWSIPLDGPVPRAATAAEQYRWAEATFPLPERASRWYLGPLLTGYQSIQPDAEEGRILNERFLALRRLADFFPDSSRHTAEALYGMGVVAMLQGDEELARTCLHLVLSRYGSERQTAAWTELALLGLQEGGTGADASRTARLKRGVDDILQRYADQSAPAAAGRLAIGDLYAAAGDQTRAFQEYARVRKEYPGERDACAASQLKIGDLFRRFASQEEVVQAYLRVIDDYPDQRQWMLPARDRVLDLLIAGRSGAAAYIARYREIVGLYRRYPELAAEAQFRIGNLLLTGKEYRAAILEFEAVETLFPDLVDEVFAARMSRAEAYLRLGDSATALSLLDQLSKEEQATRPDLAEQASDRLVAALLSSADHLRASGDLQLAALRYRNAWERDLRNLHAHRGYLECLYYQKKIDQAIDEYRQLNILHPKDNILTYALGLAYSYKGTEKAELYNDPDGLDPVFLVNRSSAVIARALSYDYTMVPGYLTIAFNFEMMENYEARQQARAIHPVRRAWKALTAPIVDIYHRLTFYEERKPARYYERAIHELNKAIVLNDENKEPLLEANLALNLANNYYSLGEFGFDKAYAYYQVKLLYDSTFIDKQREALIYERMGHCALVTEDLEKGPRFLKHAIALYAAMDKETKVLLNTKRLALLYEIGERYQAAIDYYQAAAEIEKRGNNLVDLMRSYRSVAYNYLRLNEPQEAILYARRALELLDSGKIKKIKGESSRMEIGFLGWYFPVPFIDFSTMGVNSLKSFTTEDERALLFSIFADSYQQNREYDSAIEFVRKKSELFHKRKNYRAEATFENNLAYICYLKGDYREAWRHYGRSLRLCQEYKIADGVIQNSINLGRLASGMNLQQQLGREASGTLVAQRHYADSAAVVLKDALRFLEQSTLFYGRDRSQLLLQLAEVLLIEPQPAGGGSAATGLPGTLARLDQLGQAKLYLDEALDLSRRYGLERNELAADFAIAEVYRNAGDTDQAWEQLNRCRRLALRQGEFELAWRIDLALGDLVDEMSRESKFRYAIQKTPLEFYLEAVDLLEAHSAVSVGAMASDSRRVRLQPYNRVITALARMGDQKGALVFAERQRAKLFLDLSRQETIELRKERHKIFLGNARYVQDRIDVLSSELLRARSQSDITAKQVRAWRQEREKYQQEYEEILQQVRSEVPELEGMVRVQPVELLRLQRTLQNREAVVVNQLLPAGMLVWTIRPQSIDMGEIPLAGAEVAAALRRWSEAGQAATILQDTLWQAMTAPLLRLPVEVQRLVVIPDGALLGMPWGASVQAARGHELAVTLSSSLTGYYYAEQKRKLQGDTIHLADNPPLAGSDSFVAWERGLFYSGLPGFLTSLWPGDQAREREFFDLFYSHLKSMPPAAALALTQRDLAGRGLPFSEWGRFQYYGFGGMTEAEERQFAVEGFTGTVRRGHSAFQLGEWHDAIAFYEEAMQMAERQGDSESKTRLEERILEAAVNGGFWSKAIEIQQRALQTAKGAGKVDALASSLNNLAYFYTRNGQYDEGVAAKKEYAELAQKYGLQEQEAQSLRETGLIYERGGQYDQAMALFDQAFALYERIGKPLGMGQSLRDKGRIEFLYRDHYTAALALQEQALALLRSEAAGSDLIDALHNLGITHEKMGEYPAALRIQTEALAIARKNGSDREVALSQQNLANVQWKMGEYQAALANQNAALETFTRLNEEPLLQTAYATRGLLALSLGQPQQALEFEQKALVIATRLDDRLNQATIQKNLGMIYRADGRFELARASFEQARVQDSLLVSRRGLAYDYRNLAAIYGLIGRGPEGVGLARRALDLSRDILDRRNEAQSLLVLGTLQRRFGAPDSARRHLAMAAALADSMFMPDIGWRAQRQLADLYDAEKNRSSQIAALYASLEIIEGLRARIRVEDYAAGFIDDKLEVYGALIDVLAAAERTGEALEVAERARARGFLDLLGQKQIPFADPADARLAAAGDSLQTELARAQSELLYLQTQNDPLQAQHLRQLQERIGMLRRSYSDHLTRVRTTNPELSTLLEVRPLGKEAIQRLVPEKGGMLVYHLLRDRLFIWLVTPQAIQLQRVEIGEAALAEQVSTLRRTLGRQLSIDEIARTLHDELIKPFGAEIARCGHLVILPHGALHYLPFAVLQDDAKRYLGVEHTLSFAASASVLASCLARGESYVSQEKRQMHVLAFGDPDLGDHQYDLPFAEREAASLKRYYPQVTLFTGPEASETHLRAALPSPPLVLFSCHGVYDEANPLLSALLLAPDGRNDGRLEAHEIFALKMEAYLVAMSACETGIGALRSGDEMIGLTRSFTYAGAASQLATLWKVDDLAAAVLVKRFFRHLAEGESRPEALRKAQQIVAAELNPYPAFWAAFQISGDYR